jgi:DNA repair protein RadD
MGYTLRPYQQEAVDAVITHVRKRLSPCLLELATGAGKSLIVAELAKFFVKAASTKRVLCIAPSKELVEQNAEKYALTGNKASIYCASAGKKCLRSQVIFASPQSALGTIDKIAHMGVSAIIIDEAHGITPTMQKLIDAVLQYTIKDKLVNDKCRIIGMTATPYRMGTGYIYAIDAIGEEEIVHDETKAIEPFYSKLLYKITAGELVNDGYLSQVKIGDSSDRYDTSKLETDKFGRFSAKSIEQTFSGNTKTERIIQRVIANSSDKMGVMIFAATISHANEIASYLPNGESAVIDGTLKKADRQEKIESFKARRYKYIVNVNVLTVGFDCPHVDYVVVMRATESAMLFQQIIGRGLRLHDDKEHCLISDFAENIERHKLQSDIFTPEINARIKSGESTEISVTCPACNCVSNKKRRNDDAYAGLAHDKFGNFIISGTEKPTVWGDDNGNRYYGPGNQNNRHPVEWEGMPLMMEVLDPTTKDEFGDCSSKEIPIPAHYSRRCSNPEAYILSGKPIQCSHRYSMKICPECHAENDIAARHCIRCKERLVDPNEKLVEKAGQAGVIATGETKLIHCLSAKYESYTGGAGTKSVKATYATEIGSVIAWHTKKQHWVFNRLARANGTDLETIDADYSQCDFWTTAPHQLKVKKTLGQNGYAKFEVKSVEFLAEQVSESVA